MKTTDVGDTGFFGVLSDISLEDYIQLICMKNSTKAIRVTQQGEKGLIFIDQGKIIFSSQDRLLGIDALCQILSQGKFMLSLERFVTVVIPWNFQIIKNQARRKTELSHFLSYITYAFAFKEADSKSAQSRDIFRTVTF